jgi:hypothetical protein
MKRLPRGADELRRGPQTGKSRAINIMAISSVDDSLQVSRNRNAVVTCYGSFCFQESGHTPCLVSNFNPQIILCKKKIPITSKYQHMHGVLNVDEIKN